MSRIQAGFAKQSIHIFIEINTRRKSFDDLETFSYLPTKFETSNRSAGHFFLYFSSSIDTFNENPGRYTNEMNALKEQLKSLGMNRPNGESKILYDSL